MKINYSLRTCISIALLIVALMITASSCKKDKSGDSNPANKTTTIAGIVTNRIGTPLSGVTIKAGTETTLSDASGLFMISDAAVESRLYVTGTKAGYFKGCVSAITKINGITRIEIRMLEDTPDFQTDLSTDQTLTLTDGSALNFSANSVANSNGSIYSGTVNVAVKHLNPSDPDFAFVAPGTDFSATNLSGTDQQLFSYGMLAVKLTDISGNELQIASGKTAGITMNIPVNLLTNAPASIPLWHFNETSGIWEEEGSATLQGDKYVGTVSHFSTWNCDYPTSRATVKGRILDCANKPLGGVRVTIGQTYAYTDVDGNYESYVPSATAFTVQVNEPSLGLISAVTNISALTTGQEYSVSSITVTCPAYITGTITCSSGNSFSGYVTADWGSGNSFVPVNSTGNFSIAVPATITSASLMISGVSISFTQTVSVTLPGTAGQSVSAGTFEVCGNTSGGGYISTFTLNGDGYSNKLVTINSNPQFASAQYQIGDAITIGYVTSLNGIIETSFPGNTTGTWNSLVDDLVLALNIDGKTYLQDDINLTVTDYPLVGGKVKGTFSGTLIRTEVDQQTGQVTTYNATVSNGSFEMIRIADVQ